MVQKGFEKFMPVCILKAFTQDGSDTAVEIYQLTRARLALNLFSFLFLMHPPPGDGKKVSKIRVQAEKAVLQLLSLDVIAGPVGYGQVGTVHSAQLR